MNTDTETALTRIAPIDANSGKSFNSRKFVEFASKFLVPHPRPFVFIRGLGLFVRLQSSVPEKKNRLKARFAAGFSALSGLKQLISHSRFVRIGHYSHS